MTALDSGAVNYFEELLLHLAPLAPKFAALDSLLDYVVAHVFPSSDFELFVDYAVDESVTMELSMAMLAVLMIRCPKEVCLVAWIVVEAFADQDLNCLMAWVVHLCYMQSSNKLLLFVVEMAFQEGNICGFKIFNESEGLSTNKKQKFILPASSTRKAMVCCMPMLSVVTHLTLIYSYGLPTIIAIFGKHCIEAT